MIDRIFPRLAAAFLLGGVLQSMPVLTAVAGERPVAPAEATGVDRLRARFLTPSGPVMVVAHRGCWRETSENSLAAVAACLRLGVELIELDVQRTRDGHLILMHDSTVDRTTDGTGAVADLTLAQIKALRLKAGEGGAAAALTDEAPPTFAEAMRAVRGRALVNVDAKGEVNRQALEELRQLGLASQALFKSAASSDDPALQALLGDPALLFMPILRERDGVVLAAAAGAYGRPLPAYEVTFDTETFFARGAPALRARPARVWVNTLERRHAAGHVDADAVTAPADHWGRLIAMGANVIQTDHPAELLAWLQACGCGGGAEGSRDPAVR